MTMEQLKSSTIMPLEALQDYTKVIRQKEYPESSKASTIAYEKGLDRTLASLRASLDQEVERSLQVCFYMVTEIKLNVSVAGEYY